MSKRYPMVEEVTPETMAGNSARERALNSLITRTFIGRARLPADECLSEAEHIISLKNNGASREQIVSYVASQFSVIDAPPSSNHNANVLRQTNAIAGDIFKILNGH